MTTYLWANLSLQGEDLGGDEVTQVCYDAIIHAIALIAWLLCLLEHALFFTLERATGFEPALRGGTPTGTENLCATLTLHPLPVVIIVLGSSQ